MTTKPTIEGNKALNSTLTSSEWNTNVLQQANYIDEVITGANTDKIAATGLASPLALADTFSTHGGPSIAIDTGSSSGHAVNGTTGTISFVTNFNGRTPQVIAIASQGTLVLASVSATGFTVTQAGGAGTYALYWIAIG